MLYRKHFKNTNLNLSLIRKRPNTRNKGSVRGFNRRYTTVKLMCNVIVGRLWFWSQDDYHSISTITVPRSLFLSLSLDPKIYLWFYTFSSCGYICMFSFNPSLRFGCCWMFSLYVAFEICFICGIRNDKRANNNINVIITYINFVCFIGPRMFVFSRYRSNTIIGRNVKTTIKNGVHQLLKLVTFVFKMWTRGVASRGDRKSAHVNPDRFENAQNRIWSHEFYYLLSTTSVLQKCVRISSRRHVAQRPCEDISVKTIFTFYAFGEQTVPLHRFDGMTALCAD